MIVTVGTDDSLASSGAQLDYYQSVIDRMGRATVETLKLFVPSPPVPAVSSTGPSASTATVEAPMTWAMAVSSSAVSPFATATALSLARIWGPSATSPKSSRFDV
jgi:hypothetical protein